MSKYRLGRKCVKSSAPEAPGDAAISAVCVPVRHHRGLPERRAQPSHAQHLAWSEHPRNRTSLRPERALTARELSTPARRSPSACFLRHSTTSIHVNSNGNRCEAHAVPPRVRLTTLMLAVNSLGYRPITDSNCPNMDGRSRHSNGCAPPRVHQRIRISVGSRPRDQGDYRQRSREPKAPASSRRDSVAASRGADGQRCEGTGSRRRRDERVTRRNGAAREQGSAAMTNVEPPRSDVQGIRRHRRH